MKLSAFGNPVLARAALAFDESKHSRDDDGKFGSAGATRDAGAHTKDASKKGEPDYHSKGEALHRAAAVAHKADAESETSNDRRAYHEVMSQAHTTAADAHAKAGAKQDPPKEESKEDAEKRMDAEAEARVRTPEYQKRLAAKKKRDIEWQKTHEK